MKRTVCLIGAILLAGFLSFFDPARLAFTFSFAALAEFLMVSALSVLFFCRSARFSDISLTKKDYFFSIVFGFCLTLGYGLLRGNGFDVFYGSVFAVIITVLSLAYYCVFSVYLLKYLYAVVCSWLKKNIDGKIKSKVRFLGYIYQKIEQNKFVFYFVVLVISWLPAFIIHFPGMLMFDSILQMSMYYGLPNNHTDASVLINPNQTITMHHSVIHTLAVGKFVDLGRAVFGTAEAGIFLYTLLQFVVITLVVAYLFRSIRPYLGVKWTALFLVIFALHPFFSTCAILMTKDIYFCAFFVIYMIKYYELLRDPQKLKNIKFFLQFLLVTIALLLFRNNAIYTIILVSAVLFIFLKPKKQILAYIALFLIFHVGYGSFLMPALEISSGSPREALSVPFQQTAYYVNKYEDEVTDEEKEAISKILDYDNMLENYDPEKSDAVKDTYNKYATKEELVDYFVVWFKMFLKHPVSYVESFLHLNYGYYFPSVKDSVTYDCMNDYYARNNGVNRGLPLDEAEKPGFFKMTYYNIYLFLANCPFLCLLTDTGIFVWIWFFIALFIINKFAKDKKKYLLYLVPYFAYMIFILVGPANGTIYFRYVMPFMFTLPLMFMPMFEYKLESKKEEN